MLKLAADLRWQWIHANGYNPITVNRFQGGIVYTVNAHFGMGAYRLCTIKRIN